MARVVQQDPGDRSPGKPSPEMAIQQQCREIDADGPVKGSDPVSVLDNQLPRTKLDGGKLPSPLEQGRDGGAGLATVKKTEPRQCRDAVTDPDQRHSQPVRRLDVALNRMFRHAEAGSIVANDRQVAEILRPELCAFSRQ